MSCEKNKTHILIENAFFLKVNAVSVLNMIKNLQEEIQVRLKLKSKFRDKIIFEITIVCFISNETFFSGD